MEQQAALKFRLRRLKGSAVETAHGAEAARGGLPLVVQSGQSRRLVCGALPERGRALCLVALGGAADAEALYLRATAEADPFRRADAAGRLLALLGGDMDEACCSSGMERGAFARLLRLRCLSSPERGLAEACRLSERTLAGLACLPAPQRRRLLVVLANRRMRGAELAQRLDGGRCRLRTATAVRDERIVLNTVKRAAEQISRAGFEAELRTRALPDCTEYRILVRARERTAPHTGE